MNTGVMGQLQRVGKALMVPIAVLPAAGLLLRFGQGDLLGQVWKLGVLADAGGAIFGQLALLFAVGIAIGLTNNAGRAAMAGAVAYFAFTATLSAVNADLDMSILAGILTGVVAAWCTKRTAGDRFQGALSFLNGGGFTAVLSAVVSVVLGLIFGLFWGPAQAAINGMGEWIVTVGVAGPAIFMFFNRLLIPLGLHHVLNSLVWFVFGSFTGSSGNTVTGDLWRFFEGDPTAGSFMVGFFPMMMFGLVGAAVAMYQEARPENKKVVYGIMLSAALTSFLTGITEPLEFAFLFVSPLLYVLHALLTGLSALITTLLGIKHGFTFSAGFIDFLLNWKYATNAWLLIPIGLAFGVVYWAVFRYAIRAFNLMTPGREAADDANDAAAIGAAGD